MVRMKAAILLRVALSLMALTQATWAREPRVRLIIETDAGGDPDDEQSLVRFLVYASEFDIEGIIANRREARDGENKNPVRDGLGIVQAMVKAYGECWPNLVRHNPRFPSAHQLLERTVAGYDTDAGVDLLIRAVDAPDDERPVWFCNWGTDDGAAVSCLRRALDRVLRGRGKQGYAKFKNRIRLSSTDAFGEHTAQIDPSFPLWVNTSHPTRDGKRWYHRFSPLTAKAGGFDIERDVRTGHGPLGAMYPLNTTHPQKEGDTMMFLYLLPTGMNDPNEPSWGSWAGRHGPSEIYPGRPYFWANQVDTWNGTTNRDNVLARWAVAIQNDFRARMDWCVAKEFAKANHNPVAVLNGDATKNVLSLTARGGEIVKLSAQGSRDPDENQLAMRWFTYPEAGTLTEDVHLRGVDAIECSFVAPRVTAPATVHVILELRDNGDPQLYAFRRAVITVSP
jgi:hypothetical protein